MKSYYNTFLTLFLMLSSVMVFSQTLDHVQGEMIVMLHKDESPDRLYRKYKRFDNQETGIKIAQILSDPLNIWKISIDYKNINENKIRKSLNEQPEVQASQKNYLCRYRNIPNDPFFNQQWQYINNGDDGGLMDVDTDIEDAWDITTGGVSALGDTIVICVIDDGSDQNHQDLIDNYWINKNEIPNNGIDDDQNDYIDDVNGWDAINDDGNIFREGGHGTSVSGVIGAVGNNLLGVTGVNWNVKIMSIRGGSTSTNGLKAYIYAYKQRKLYNESNGTKGAFVVATNASWGFPNKKESDSPIFCAFFDELGKIGIVNATATTNDNLNVDKDGDLPTHCTSPYLITVTNLTKNGQKASSAGYGAVSVDLAAPGNRIYTTGKPDRYREFEGTSGSSPLVAGAVGLMYATPCPELISLSKSNPADAALKARDIILGSVDYNPNMQGFTFTQGNLNIGNAVTIVQDMCDFCTYPTNIQSMPNGQSIDLFWDNKNFASSSEIRYRKVGGDWSYQANLQNSYSIMNLQGCTIYEVQFRSDCAQKGPYSHSYYIETDNCCKSPGNIEIENNSNSIVVNWEDISAANNYTIEFSPIGENNWEKAVVTEPQFILYGVTSCSTYKFRINTTCGFQTTEFSNEQNYTINCDACQNEDYCGDVFMDNDYEWIQSIKIGSFQFESDKNIGGYGNYIGIPGIVLQQGEEVSMEVNINYSDIPFTENVAAYIDWNQNGVFEAEERAFSPGSGTNTLSKNIFVPTNAVPGITRMRVILAYEDISSGCKDLTIEAGEIEDYCVVIQSLTQCSGNVTIDNFSTTSSSISVLWTEVEGAQSYLLEYKEESADEFISISTESPELLIGNLNECSTYTIRVKSLCSNGETDFSRSATIRTRCTTSVTDPEGLLKSYSINPNPFADHLNIQLEGTFNSTKSQLIMYDIGGTEIINSPVNSIENNHYQLNDLSGLPNGLYILKIQNGSLSITEKLIKI